MLTRIHSSASENYWRVNLLTWLLTYGTQRLFWQIHLQLYTIYSCIVGLWCVCDEVATWLRCGFDVDHWMWCRVIFVVMTMRGGQNFIYYLWIRQHRNLLFSNKIVNVFSKLSWPCHTSSQIPRSTSTCNTILLNRDSEFVSINVK